MVTVESHTPQTQSDLEQRSLLEDVGNRRIEKTPKALRVL